MNNDEYADELNKVVKYGRYVSRDEIEKFNTDPQSLGILADYLEEHSDPRHILLRQRLGQLKSNAPHPHDVGESILNTWKQPSLALHPDPKSTLTFIAHKGKFGNMVETLWRYGHRTEDQTRLHGDGDLTVDEARDFANQLPEEHQQYLHQWLDHHFGERK